VRVLAAVHAAFLSDEDLPGGLEGSRDLLDGWARQVPLLVVTGGEGETHVALEGRWHVLGAFPAHQVEGTGAGDSFAAGFLIRYHETADAAEAARFAAAVASFVVEGYGSGGAPTRDRVERRLREHPEVRLRPA
jgi:sugar/nucleoside kinase (ribokinase family)